MKRPTVSLCAIALNGGEGLARMIRSARPVVDELVIAVDSRTTDDSRDRAAYLGARTVAFDWADDFAVARNGALDAAHGEWILVLDADDRLLPLGVTAIRRALDPYSQLNAAIAQLPPVTGYCFGIREEHLDGTEIGVVASSGRLFRRSANLRYHGRVHEEILYQGDRSRTRWGLIEGVHIAHTGYDPSLLEAKRARNERLLKLRIEDDPDDVYAAYYLACQFELEGRPNEAARWADYALSGTDPLKAEHCRAMERVLEGATPRFRTA